MKNLLLRFRGALLLPAVFFGLSIAGMAPASDQPTPIDSSGAEITDLWFVELESPPLAAGGRAQRVQSDKQNFRSAAAQAGIQFEERYAFDTLWNGFSIRVNPSQVSTLSMLPGVKGVYPVDIIHAPEPGDEISPDLFTALAMTGADFAQDTLGLSGAGIKVAVMDTGIDYNHPDLGGPGPFPTVRVAFGTDFVGDDFNAADPDNNTPMPDDDPMDCNGHGTHVAGIVGADAADPETGVTGVAPSVTFGAYKVFGCVGSTFSDIMIAAMEAALADGMDILNMSIGSAFQWPQHPTAAASKNLVNAGMTVVASIGNSGAFGVYSSSSPGVGEKVIGVASVDNSHVAVPFFIVEEEEIGYIAMSGAPAPPTSGTEEIVFIGQACNADLPLDADPDGKVALAVRGACTFREKAENAIAAGATAVVIHNSSPGLFSGTVGTPALDKPVVGISQADGLFIRTLEPVDMTWAEGLTSAPNPNGGLISSFSSYGLSPDLDLKPDISAPGGLIFSTLPIALGSYGTLSGTSMSSPHVAGAAALLLEARPNTSSHAVRGILQNSADPFVWWGNPGLGFMDNVHRQGAGLLDIPGSILSTTKIEPAKLSLGAIDSGTPVLHTLTIENSTDDPVTYDLSHVPALGTHGSTFSPSFNAAFASVTIPPSVIVPANGSAMVDVEISRNPTLANLQFGGYVVFTSQADGAVFRVPYAGFAGDYQAIVAMPPALGGLLPALGILTDPGPPRSFGLAPAGHVFTMEDELTIPWFLVHLAHQVRRLRIEVFDADSGKSFHRAAEIQYLGRNSTTGGFFAIPFNGVTFRGLNASEVPDGNYVLHASVQKALGDGDNPDHWEHFTTVHFTIERP